MGTNSSYAQWPVKHKLFGIGVSATNYDDLISNILLSAMRGQPAMLTLAAVHCLMCGAADSEHRKRLNAFDVIATDGQPLRWALNLLRGTDLREHVHGPELTRRTCEAAARHGVPIYLYGGSREVLEKLNGI